MSARDYIRHIEERRLIFSISICDLGATDTQIDELVECLLIHPDAVNEVAITFGQLTDEIGVKFARYVAASSTLTRLNLSFNAFGTATFVAMASALCINTSLRGLFLNNNAAANEGVVYDAFVRALRINPDRPENSVWWLHPHQHEDYRQLKTTAERMGHPTLQELLLGGRDIGNVLIE